MKKALCLIIIVLFIFPFSRSAFAVNYSQKNFDHDRFLGEVLFGATDYKNKKLDKQYRDKIKMLQYASYLAIDQMNNNKVGRQKGQRALSYLRLRWVTGLPINVDSINPTKDQPQLSGTNHRSYTHMGWKYDYKQGRALRDIAHSDIRAKILTNTVARVFDFNLKPSSDIIEKIGIFAGMKYDDEKCDAFCRLVYYVHILGDCYEDMNFFQANGSNNGFKIPLGREHPNESSDYSKRIQDTCIIDELLHLMPDLFSEQKGSSDYKELMEKLRERTEEIRALYSKTGGINSDERYQEYHDQVDKLMEVLLQYIHKLLIKEEFFSKAFS